MDYKNETLRKLQLIEFNILEDFKKICADNNLHYFLIGGTLLGAVRHGGFIPWDDDIDIGMERNEYNKFINIWKNKYQYEQKKYYLQCKEIDERTPLPYAKMRLNGTLFVEKETETSSLHKGIFIDIFPFDCLKNKVSFVFKLKYYIFRYLMVVSEYKNGYRGFSSKIKRIITQIGSFLSYDQINKFQYKFMTQYNNENECKFITSMASGYGFRRHCCQRDNLCGGNTIKFNNDYFECPNDCDAYLRNLFGTNYMQIPPKEKQQTIHSVIEIDFGKY